MKTVARIRELARVRRALGGLHSLRLQMMLIVALTGAVGFLASVTLLSGGMAAMWMRYPLAVAAAYASFLLFLWCWLRLKWDFDPSIDVGSGPGNAGASVNDPPLPWEAGGGEFGGGGASGSFDNIESVSMGDTGHTFESVDKVVENVGSAIDLEEFTIVVIAIVALIAAVVASMWVIWIAPAFFAELTLDAALATGLYRRLRDVSGDHWLRTAIRRTIWPMAGLCLLFALAGFLMQLYAPEARSIGQVFSEQER